MATARENQGYLIAIILLVLLTVLLAILTYFAFSSAGAATSNLEAKTEELANSNARLEAYQEQSAILKSYLGMNNFSVSEVDQRMQMLQRTEVSDVIQETQSIQSTYNTDMARYIKPTSEGTEKTYRGLVEDFASAIAEKHVQIAQLNNSVEMAQETKESELASKDKEIEQVNDRLSQVRSDLADEKTRHQQTKDQLQQQLREAEASNQRISQEFAQRSQEWEDTRESLESDMAALTGTVQALRERLRKYERTRTEIADGQVLRVSPSNDMVYIDLGSLDQLRTRQTFSIYDPYVNTYERDKDKAKIEVTKIVGPHRAEARIMEQQPTNPILSGDHVVTTTWEPGYAVPIALAGFFDLDDDGESDLDRIISMIQQNGGKVVAYHDMEGNVTGEIDANTRYLALGEEPQELPAIRGQSRLIEQADKFEVQEIAARELLNSLGLRSQAKVIKTPGLSGSDFPKRQPPRSRNNSAFDNGDGGQE